KSEDLIQYGFESEFIGRLPVVTVFEHLEVEDLYNILRNPKSPIIIGKKRDFKAYGIDLQFEDEALHRIAENAFLERTGARGLVSAVEKVLIKFEHALPSTDIRHLAVTSAMVADPAGELEKILQRPDDPEREARFQTLLAEEEGELEKSMRLKENELLEGYGIYFSDHRRFSARNEIQFGFTEEAIDLFAERVWKEGGDAGEALKQSYHNYDHGLKLIREKTGVREFLIPPEGIENPDGYLNQMIREIYKDE
ncbi:MAG: family ATPase, partial [Deltaproteobacteria bacterium]|nr:family ATPase [Deltaproteobacteria bacterium]